LYNVAYNVQLKIKLLQCNAATDLKRGGRIYFCFFGLFLNLSFDEMVKNIKIVYFPKL